MLLNGCLKPLWSIHRSAIILYMFNLGSSSLLRPDSTIQGYAVVSGTGILAADTLGVMGYRVGSSVAQTCLSGTSHGCLIGLGSGPGWWPWNLCPKSVWGRLWSNGCCGAFLSGQHWLFWRVVLHWLFCVMRPDRLAFAPKRHKWGLCAHDPVTVYWYIVNQFECVNVIRCKYSIHVIQH